ncbi:ATP-dependent Clp protease proteolytic subunit [Gordonia sp. ABSL1-1]|uniref:head maturation protease, ClpP-related n=1 Tax=Gordonia sp. ABSL1-1 TaxID=3053923 RepID=UPI0025747366|nr:head maturation protease, ClpP-related [Gordonia sp. ABSL1-1]MDL9938691.1 ATP-dependent Clp protease proteolytic subunit [Gordonia sp. ABSL1-1]
MVTPNSLRWYSITAKADDRSAEVLIYDEIDPFWGVSANVFAREIAALDVDNLTVRINSPGGDVFDGIAILNSLRNHPAKVTTVIDGLAASAASFIAMAGDEIVMSRNAEMMIHDAVGITVGNAEKMQRMVDMLERASNNIASIYAERAGGTVDEWRAVMRKETWYTADGAVEAGLADRVDTAAESSESAPARNLFDRSIINRRTRTPLAAVASEVNKKEEDHMSTLNEGLVERLGIAADANDETILKALDDKIAETTANEPAEPTVDQITASAKELGLTLVDSDQYQALAAAAEDGRQARLQQVRDADERLVVAAMEDGRIAPARKAHWLTQLEADREGITDVINSLPKGTIPVEEIGHGQDVQDAAADDVYSKLFPESEA